MHHDRTLDDILPVDETSEFQIELATLSEEAQQDVVDALHDMTDAELEEADLDQMIIDAEIIDDKQDLADEHQEDQREAVANGDYEAAREDAVEAVNELQDAETIKETGGFRDDAEESWELQETQQDVDALDAADWQQDLGDDQVADAEVADGWAHDGVNDEADLATVDAHLDAADDHFDAADDYAASTLNGQDDINDANDYDYD